MKVDCGPSDGAFAVLVDISLSREEVSRLFLLGDILLSWPTEGLLPAGSGAPISRGCMYVSELQGRSGGLRLVFTDQAFADRAQAIISTQLEQARARLTADVEMVSSQRTTAGTDQMHEVVAGYLDLPGIIAALLVSSHGLLISSAEKDPVDGEAIAALVADVILAAKHIGKNAGGGTLDTIDMEYRRFGLTVAPFDAEISLVLVRPPVASRV